LEEGAERRIRVPTSISAENLSKLLTRRVGQATASVRLFFGGKCTWRVRVPERISKEDLRREASKMMKGRVRVVPETYPLTEDSVVDCIPSFVEVSAIPDESYAMAVKYLVHG
jgi:hypothetical protein